MRTRVAVVALLLLAVPVPQTMAAKQVCRIVQDARGDAEYLRNGVPGDDGDDLLSADLASDGVQVTAVWRLAALRVPNPVAPVGQHVAVYFNVPGTTRLLYLDAGTGPASGYTYGFVEPGLSAPQLHPLGSGRGVLSTSRSEVRMTVPVRGFSSTGARITRGSRMRSIRVLVSRDQVPELGTPVGQVGSRMTFDDAEGRSYVVGTPSCARPVR